MASLDVSWARGGGADILRYFSFLGSKVAWRIHIWVKGWAWWGIHHIVCSSIRKSQKSKSQNPKISILNPASSPKVGDMWAYTLPFYFLGVLPSISALCAMSNSAKKKTTAMREVRAPQPGAAHQCRRLLFDWPLPRTHAHIFACRWLGACMPPPTPPAEVQQSPGVLLQQQNGPFVCFPNAGYRVISTCADPNRPVQRES